MTMIRARRRDDGVMGQIMEDGSEVPIQSRTDWARVDAMTDADIARAVADDPDAAPLPTDARLAGTRVVWPTDIAATGTGSASARPSSTLGSASRPAP